MDGESESTDEENESTDGIDRRTVLKGTAAAGIAGTAAAGTASADGWNELDLCAAGDELFDFTIEVTGELKRGRKYATDKQDRVGSNFVDGQVWKGKCDSYLFTGDIETMRLDGPGKVFVNGELVRDTTEKEFPHQLTVEAQGHPVSYKFKVTGHVMKGKWADSADEIVDSSVVRGEIDDDGVDTFWFDGTLVFEEPDDALDVTIEYYEA